MTLNPDALFTYDSPHCVAMCVRMCVLRRVVGPCGSQLKPASDGGPGRCARLGVQLGDVVLQVNGTNIGACAEASGTSHYLTACRLLREATFPLQVIYQRRVA
jgi:hypothetical protein